MAKKDFNYNAGQTQRVALNGFEIVDYPPFVSHRDDHHTSDKKGKKYIVFNYRDDKERFEYEHSSSIVKSLTKKRALKLLEADGVDMKILNQMGKYPEFWDEFVAQHGTSRYLVGDE